MSGHSKWATIHRQKEVKDAKRGAVFTRLGAAITIAVREGGGIADSNTNFRLRLAVDKARMANMPKENIQRAVDRGVGQGGQDRLEEVTYEGFGPGGTAILVETASDNKMRTISEVKNIFERGGGTMGGHGSVGYMFEKKGYLLIEPSGSSRDELELMLIDLGATDLVEVEEGIEVYCDPQKTYQIKIDCEKIGLKIDTVEQIMHPTTTIQIQDEDRTKLDALVEKFEQLDDVQKVYTNVL